VQSGQHDGFTRLVLTLPEPGGWDFGRTEDGYAFRTRRPGLRYDLSTVYDRIPRDRLSALWVDPETGVLRLGLGCACHAIATPFRPGIIVVDIADGAAPAGSPFEAGFQDAGRPMPMVMTPAVLRPRARPQGLAVPESVQSGATAELPGPGPLPPRSAELPGIPVAIPSPRSSALREALLRDLSRGIAQGAVTPVLELPAAPGEARTAPSEVQAPTPVNDALAEPAMPEQVAIRPVGAQPRLDTTSAGQACIADDRLDIAAWGGTGSVPDQLAQARTGILTEFDRPDREGVLHLVRLHIHLGFGAEARSLLRLWAPADPEGPLLDALGILVDGAGGAPLFAGMQGCPTAAALWAVLAAPRLSAAEPVDRAAVLRAFSALPIALRRHLGPALSDRFLALGDAEAARSILDTVNRAAGPHGDGMAMVDARLDLAEGRPDAAEPKLRAIVADDGLAAAQALATLIDTRIAAGEPPALADIVSLEAYLLEHRGMPETVALRAALLRGFTVAGLAEKAFGQLTADDEALAPDLWQLLAVHGDDATVFALAAEPAGPAVAGLPVATRLAMARRVLAIGFPDVAGQWVVGLTGPEPDLLQAEIALALRDGRATLRHLSGQDTPEAQRLRAAALELLGDLEGAASAWLAAGNQDAAARLRFQQQRWAEIDMADDPALAALVAALDGVASAPAADATDPSLSAARALVEATAAVRADIAQVLAARTVPEN
jgi:hypothetical protein